MLALGLLAQNANAEDLSVNDYRIEKKILNGNGTPVESSTFEQGDKIVSQIKIEHTAARATVFKVRDYRPAIEADGYVPIISEIKDKASCGLSSGDSLISGAAFSKNPTGEYSQWSEVSLGTPSGYLCYSYELAPSTLEAHPKNSFYQTKTILAKIDGSTDIIVANTQNSILIKGFVFNNSLKNPPRLNTERLANPGIFPINDLLLFSKTNLEYTNLSSQTIKNPILNSYVYQKGSGAATRGGEMLFLPATMTNSAGTRVIAQFTSYLLYNPAFYLFGNLYGATGTMGSLLDLGSRSTSINAQDTLDASNAQTDINAKASLYGYKIDENAVAYWDSSNPDKNKSLYENIKKLIPPATGSADPIVCNLKGNAAAITNATTLNLDNQNCQLSQSSDGTWPNGRVWYLKTNKAVEIKGKVAGKGTLLIDYDGALGSPSVSISTPASAFGALSNMGLMVINGGNVVFGTSCEKYRGVVFVPGKGSLGGNITFAEGGHGIKISGSIVADRVNFAKRDAGLWLYSVGIYTDSQILNSPPPGFETVMPMLVGS